MRGHYRGPLHGVPIAVKDDQIAFVALLNDGRENLLRSETAGLVLGP